MQGPELVHVMTLNCELKTTHNNCRHYFNKDDIKRNSNVLTFCEQ